MSNVMAAEPLLRKVVDALDTAHGCLQLVESGIQITDLAECQREIDVARYEAAKALGWTE